VIEIIVRDLIKMKGFASTDNVIAEIKTQKTNVGTAQGAIKSVDLKVLETLSKFGIFLNTNLASEELKTQIDVLKSVLNGLDALNSDILKNIINPIVRSVNSQFNRNFDLQSFLNGKNPSFPPFNKNVPTTQNDILLKIMELLKKN